MKKNILAFALLFALLITLGACAREPEEPDVAAFHRDWIWCRQNTPKGALTEQGYYYRPRTGARPLTYMDIASGQSVILCSIPGCLHNRSECNVLCQINGCSHPGADCEAYLETVSEALLFGGGHLYYFHQDGTLRRRNATATSEVTVGLPGKAFLEAGMTVQLDQYVLTGEYLYYRAIVSEPSEGSDVSQREYVGRMHLTSGKDDVILTQELTAGWSYKSVCLCAVQDGGALIYQCEGIPVGYDDPNLGEKSREMKVFIKQWDAATGEIITILEKTRQELQQVTLVGNGKIYYSGMTDTVSMIRPDVMAYDLVTGEETTVWKQAHLIGLGNGFGVLLQDGVRSILNLKTGKTVPITGVSIPYPDAIGALGFVTKQPILDQEGSGSAIATEYCLVSYAALEDGLTADDLQIIYTQMHGLFSD